MPHTPEQKRQWRKDNPEVVSVRNAEYRTDENLSARVAANRKWRAADPARYKALALKSRLKLSYGLTVEQYEALVSAQGGLCAICASDGGGRRLAVDHCHATGKVRGLLCLNCNTALGKLGDSPSRLREAAAYLEKSYQNLTP